MNTAPIKRHESLQPFSREHHHGLLLCWKIKEGLKLEIEPERIKRYVDWFWNHHLQQHFAAEENFIFPILPPDDELILRALAEHKELKNLFEKDEDLLQTLSQIEKLLTAHIRFEERILFNKIQQTATPEQMKLVEAHHKEAGEDDWEDAFWLRKKG